MAAIAALTTIGKIAAAASAAGTLISTAGAIQSGNSQEKVAQYNAEQIKAQGRAELAEASHEAENARRKKELMLSRARAVGAHSGGGIDIDLMGDIEEEGVLNEQRIVWGGQEAMKGRFGQAEGVLAEGRAKKSASRIKGASSLLSGGRSFLETYG